MEKQFRLHKETGLLVAEDGEVMWTTTYKTGHQHTWRTYGWDNGKGYRVVTYQRKHYYVHRLVAETYIPNPDGKTEIDHIIPVSDGGTNDVSNLRWCTRGENNNNPLSRQKRKGKKQSEECVRKRAEANKKPIIGTHKKTGYTVEFESATDAWLTLNISKSDICSCCRGKLKSAGGYEWNYA